MPSATIDKLNQLKTQLEQCNNETAALLLKRTIAKLESQLQIEQRTTQSAKVNPKAASKASQKKTPKSSAQDKVKVEPQVTPQQKTVKSSQAKSKSRDNRTHQRRLLPGNGTHRAWCRIPGIIRMQEPEIEGERPVFCLDIDGHQLPLKARNRSIKWLKASLDKPLMVKCYPRIIEGQLAFAQFCGTAELTPENPEAWVLIGVWNAEQQRVLVQRDRRCDQSRRILPLSPLVSEDCLEQLEDRKLYRFECQREGVTVTVVGVEAMANELPNGA